MTCSIRRLCLVLCAALSLSACAGAGGDRAATGTGTGSVDVPGTLYLDVVRALQNEGRWNASLAYLDAYDNVREVEPSAQVLRADALAEIGDLEEARAIYQSLLSTSVAPAAQAGLGHVAAGQGNWAQAATHFTEASQARPTDAGYLNNLGYALLHTGQSDLALRALARAYELAEDAASIRNNLAIALVQAGRTSQFEALLATIDDEVERARLRSLAEGWSGAMT